MSWWQLVSHPTCFTKVTPHSILSPTGRWDRSVLYSQEKPERKQKKLFKGVSEYIFHITESTQNSFHPKLNKQSHSVRTPIPTSPPTEIGHNPEMCARKFSKVHLMGEPEVWYSKLKITVLGNQPTLRTDDCGSWKDQNAMLSDFNKLFLVGGQQSNFLKIKIVLWCAFKLALTRLQLSAVESTRGSPTATAPTRHSMQKHQRSRRSNRQHVSCH